MGALQAQMCCECGVCELFSCPMRLSPRRINVMLKARFAEEGIKYPGPRQVLAEQTALRDFRKVPVPRLAYKLDIARYMDIHPEFSGEYTPDSVRIPLQQHIGAAAVPRVNPGDTVKPGDSIGAIPQGSLGAEIHASIAGVVTEVGSSIVIKGA
jgi:cobalamin reductase